MGTTREAHGYQIPVTSKVTRATSLPTMVTGRILSLEDANAILKNGDGDLISMVRALISDPELIRKTQAGRVASVRPCISCNQGCVGGLRIHGRIGCTVNVEAGRERTLGPTLYRPARRPRHLVVVGGGPAGMEAARVAAESGHRVTLLEAGPRLGGQLRLAAKSVSRSEIGSLIAYYEHELTRLGVDVHLHQRVTAPPEVAAFEPDGVVLAIGAEPRRDAYQVWHPGGGPTGIDTVSTLTGWDVLAGVALKGPVLLLDELGHYESIDVAESLTRAGHRVHHVMRFHALGERIALGYEYAAAPHLESLAGHDYHLSTRSVVLAVAPGSATIAPIDAPHRCKELEVNSFVFMSGHLPDYGLLDSFMGSPARVVTVGDANGVRLLDAAIAEGAMAPRVLTDPDGR
jgi:hypothetical protein